MNSSESFNRRLRGMALAGVLILLFVGVFERELWTPDEPREAATALEMARGGDWVVPRLAGVPFVEKPPLYYWTAVPFIRTLAGLTDIPGAARTTSVFFGAGILLLTGWLARRLFGKGAGRPAVLMLGTMPGFVEQSHWIRSDIALMFFVLATLATLVAAFQSGRAGWWLLAGVCAGLCFLSKGLIGWLLIGTGWAGLVAAEIMRAGGRRQEAGNSGGRGAESGELRAASAGRSAGIGYWIAMHGVAALVAFAVAGIWVWYFWKRGGPDLWDEWFWVNHVGRLTGTAAAKGHIVSGKPLYYLGTLAGYTMPWLPLLAVTIWRGAKILLHREDMPASSEGKNNRAAFIFLIVWGGGSLLLLSVSATKRDIYLAPALPAFALLAGLGWQQLQPRWVQGYSRIWIGLCLVALLGAVLAPLYIWTTPALYKLIPPEASFSLANGYALLPLIGAGVLTFLLARWRGCRTAQAPDALFMMCIATALACAGLWAVAGPAVDAAKGMRQDLDAIRVRIPEIQRARIAAFRPSETMLGVFYVHAGWKLPAVSGMERAAAILAGADKEFDQLLVSGDSIDQFAPDRYSILAKQRVGNSGRRTVFWLQGVGRTVKER